MAAIRLTLDMPSVSNRDEKNDELYSLCFANVVYPF